MIQPTVVLHHDLERILSVLERGSLLSFTSEKRESLRAKAEELSLRLASIEASFLTVGLLGGTGVGKSSLMNALAGAPIASTSHRRPHTDRVLIYRHASAPVPPALLEAEVPRREITHDTDSVKQILLCDLPDFDSLLGEHRQRVLDFLEHLDLLVWVTSPEKYADGRFYEFLALVPKAAQNFSFVVNKGDLLFEGETKENGYQRLVGVTRTFQQYIRQQGVAEPLLFSVSARDVLDSPEPAPWNQFASFRQFVFQQRDVKQVTAIKTANLDVEVNKLHVVLLEEVGYLETFDRLLGRLLEDLSDRRADWLAAAKETFGIWLVNYLRQEILIAQGDPSLLVGPGYALALLLRAWQPGFTDARPLLPDSSRLSLPAELAVSLRQPLQWLSERLQHGILRENLPSAYRERLRESLDPTTTFPPVAERCTRIAALGLAKPRLSSAWTFRGRQYLAYLVLLLCLILAIGAETAWRQVLDHPRAASLLGLALSVVHTVFSSKGLAALGSYTLLNLFIGFRFHRRYRRFLEKRVEKTIEALKTMLLQAWADTLDSIQKTVNELRNEIRAEITTVQTGDTPGQSERA